jgi:hypothetical protein
LKKLILELENKSVEDLKRILAVESEKSEFMRKKILR